MCFRMTQPENPDISWNIWEREENIYQAGNSVFIQIKCDSFQLKSGSILSEGIIFSILLPHNLFLKQKDTFISV